MTHLRAPRADLRQYGSARKVVAANTGTLAISGFGTVKGVILFGTPGENRQLDISPGIDPLMHMGLCAAVDIAARRLSTEDRSAFVKVRAAIKWTIYGSGEHLVILDALGGASFSVVGEGITVYGFVEGDGEYEFSCSVNHATAVASRGRYTDILTLKAGDTYIAPIPQFADTILARGFAGAGASTLQLRADPAVITYAAAIPVGITALEEPVSGADQQFAILAGPADWSGAVWFKLRK